MMRKMAITLAMTVVLCSVMTLAYAADMIPVDLSDSAPSGNDAWQRTDAGIRISKPGEYMLSGSLEEGMVWVDCTDTGKVILYLNGVTVHNPKGPAVQIGKCDPRVVISMVEGSTNTLTNGTELVYEDGEEPDGVIFSRSDLTLDGSGKLKITAGAQNGIVSKDDLKILSGEITIECPKHGIKGKDCVEISGGKISIQAGKDGIKSTNKNDPDRGYLLISGGEITIFCTDEALSYITTCSVIGGALHLNTVR